MSIRSVTKHGKSHDVDMLNGPLATKIILFALPLAITSIVQQLFMTADGSILGTFVSDSALAAVGATTPIVSLYLDFIVGFSVGANVDIAIHIGRNEFDRVSDSVRTAIVFSFLGGIILALIGILSARPLLNLIGTPDNVMPEAVAYLSIYCLGLPFVGVYNFGSAVLRSKGDSKRPLYALAIACALNLALDLVFAIVFRLDVAGVSAATVIANIVAASIILMFLSHQPKPFDFNINNIFNKKANAGNGQMLIDRSSLRSIVRMGLPAGIQTAIFAVSNILLQSGINSFGSDAIAATAASWNYESFTYFMVSGFASACVTFTGQNYAARKYERCKKIFVLCMVFAACFAAVLAITFAIFSPFFLGLFATSTGVLAYGTIRMWMVEALEFIPFTFEVPGGALRGMGVSMLPTVITIMGSCVLRIIWLFTVFALNPTFETLLVVYPLSWAVTGIAMLIAYFRVRTTAFKKQLKA